MAATVGGSAEAQRSWGQTPGTGTLTTAAAPAWAASTAYVVDPTGGGTNRVTNGGNLYQCITSGTSASSGGPSGTGTDITDGTAHWYFIGAAPSNDTAAGSQILGVVARGAQSTAASVAPSDNDSGGSYTTIINQAYTGFPDSFAGVFRRATAANAKTAFAVSAAWGNTSAGSGIGDVITTTWVELHGVVVGAPHASSHTEVTAATGGTVTSAAITTTATCLVVSFWFGNGDTLSAGSVDTGTPLGGLALIPGATCPIALSENGYLHCAAGWRIAAPGTFTESWSTTGQGAKLITVAYAVLGAPEEAVQIGAQAPAPQPWAAPPQLAADELAVIAASTVEVDPGASASLWPVSWQIQGAVVDGDAPLSVSAVVEDDVAAQVQRGPEQWRSAVAAADDPPAPSALDEDPGPPACPGSSALPSWPGALAAAEVDLPAIILDDHMGLVTWSPAPLWSAPGTIAGDEVAPPMATAIDDESAQVEPGIGGLAWDRGVISTAVGDDLPGVATSWPLADDDALARPSAWPGWGWRSLAAIAAELVGAVSAPSTEVYDFGAPQPPQAVYDFGVSPPPQEIYGGH